MNINIYKYVITNVTPLVITAPSGYRGLSYSCVADYINGSMVRGAFLTSLMSNGLIKQDEIEKISYNIRVTPALPCNTPESKLYEDVMFAHSLAYRFKSKDVAIYSLNVSKLLDLIKKGENVKKIIVKLIKNVSDLLISTGMIKDLRHHPVEIKRMEGATIVRDNNMWKALSPEVGLYVETSIERARGSSRPGILYAYEYITPGTLFTGYISYLSKGEDDLAALLEDLSKSRKELIVRIGRGTGRGYGICRLKLESHEVKPEVIKEDIIAFEVIGPTFTISPYPRPLIKGDEISVKVPTLGSTKLKILYAIGRKTITYRGWSYLYNAPRVPITAQAPGFILIARILECQELGNILAYMPYIGLDENSTLGFNILYPLLEDFIPELEVIT